MNTEPEVKTDQVEDEEKTIEQENQEDATQELNDLEARLDIVASGGQPTPDNKGEQPSKPPETKPATGNVEAPAGGDVNHEPPEEQIPDVPATGRVKAEQFKNLRQIASKFKKERNDFREKFEAQEKRIQDLERFKAAPVVKPEATKKSTVPVGDAFQYLVKAKNEEFDESTLPSGLTNASIVLQSNRVLAGATPKEIIEVIDKASNGEFGKYSAEILAEARMFLPEVQIRSNGVTLASDANLPDEATLKSGREQSVSKVFEKYPDLKDPNSELYKAVNEYLPTFQQKHFGDLKNPTGSDAWRIVADANLPEWQIEQVLIELKAMEFDTTAEALMKENEELKKRLQIVGQPQSAGHSLQGGDENSLKTLTSKLDGLMS